MSGPSAGHVQQGTPLIEALGSKVRDLGGAGDFPVNLNAGLKQAGMAVTDAGPQAQPTSFDDIIKVQPSAAPQSPKFGQ